MIVQEKDREPEDHGEQEVAVDANDHEHAEPVWLCAGPAALNRSSARKKRTYLSKCLCSLFTFYVGNS